jgi:type III secretory pathway lipoprotein EscJ
MRIAARPIVAYASAVLCFACTAPVRSDLSEQDADAIVLALDDSGIAATKERGPGARGYAVQVGRFELAAALRALDARGALAPRQPGFEALYAEPSLVPTPGEERARLSVALAGEVARSIERLPSVLSARVHLAPPEPVVVLDGPRPAWRASVLVLRKHGSAALDEPALRGLVAGAVDGLAAHDVTLMQSEAAAHSRAAFTRVGPFSVPSASASALRMLLALGLALHALLALALITVVARRRALSASS